MSADTRTSRREILRLGTLAAVASGVAVLADGRGAPRVALAARAGSAGAAPSGLSCDEPVVTTLTHAGELLAPFGEGASIGPWKLERFLPVREGAAGILLSDASGGSFQLDICARDAAPGAPRAPAASEHFDVFLANGGEGTTPSCEQHGLAAMAVADVIRFNEARLAHGGFSTLRERLSSCDDAAPGSV
jgi:hypothetical protein